MIFKLGELFCGPGGLAYGALRSQAKKGDKVYSIQHAWANDYDKNSCETFKKNICPTENKKTVFCEDVRLFVRNFKKYELEPIDIFAYGFPCNDFSIVGESKGFHGDFGPLYSYGVKLINHFRPKAFVAENVGGIRSANQGTAFFKILSDLESAGNGYHITAHLFKSEEYGVPQARHRIIIVGTSLQINGTFRVPKPTTPNQINQKTAKEALSNIPKDAANNELTTQSQTVVQRLMHIKPGENAWNSNLPKELRLNVKGAKLSQIYRRLHPDKPSYTITGSGGGGTHCYHWKEPRALTNRERARIQTFPDNYVFSGSKESVRKQIGMAVPPDLSQVVFEALLKSLAGISYEWVEPNIRLDRSSPNDLKKLANE